METWGLKDEKKEEPPKTQPSKKQTSQKRVTQPSENGVKEAQPGEKCIEETEPGENCVKKEPQPVEKCVKKDDPMFRDGHPPYMGPYTLKFKKSVLNGKIFFHPILTYIPRIDAELSESGLIFGRRQ